MRRWTRSSLLALGALAAAAMPACSTFRAQLGVGLGLGVVVKLPALLHVGVGMGLYQKYGHLYDEGWTSTAALFDNVDYIEIESCATFVHLLSFNEVFRDSDNQRASHVCLLFPLGIPLLGPDDATWKPRNFELAEPYGLELALWLGPVMIELGWNPWFLFAPPPEPVGPA